MREWLHTILPAWAKDAPFLLENWQWVALAMIFTGLLAIDVLARFLLSGIPPLLGKRLGLPAHRLQGLRSCVRPLAASVGAASFVLIVPELELQGQAAGIADGLGRAILTLALAWLAFRVVDVLGDMAGERVAKSTNQLDDLLVPLIRKSLKTLVVIFGVIYFAISVKLEITPLLTGLGISSLAIGFAAKSTVENLFGSMTVILDRPFQIGDWVVIGSVEGTVESMGLRSTRVRTFYDSQVVIPNSTLLSANVDNYGRRRFRRWRTMLGVEYGTPPERLDAFVTAMRDLFASQPNARPDRNHIVVNEFADSSINILVYVFFEAKDWETELASRQRFILDIMRLAEKMNVAFAFPSRTIYMAAGSDGGATLAPTST
ncbi:MAG: mechanosensitive ion channel family protein [Planctomycetota bacterium]|nr:mechanosensitive ion channel family protein [Planctomycetota bacterium]MDA1106472.1 mechanosensitive ion channel family protein [Planctomycetota bacterium]